MIKKLWKSILLVSATALLQSQVMANSPEKVEAAKIAQDVRAFMDEMIKEHEFTEQEMMTWFEGAEPDQGIIKTITRPAEAALPWHRYRKIFIQQERVDKGLEFWKEHSETLKRAEETFGVPAEVIVGLIGVETKYGRIMGKHDVFNALYTLGFHFPRRATFFKKELREFLILAREQEWTPETIKGSYAGAMGYGQFMPSSYRMYAVDFDNDGKINLLSNPVDAIGSVANYLKVHGWEKDGAMIYPAKVSGDAYKTMLKKRLKPTDPVKNLIEAGVEVSDELSPDEKAILIELEQTDGMEYWVGLHNFYVISRYNPRTLYTMAVIQLTEMIRDQYAAKG